MTRDSARLWSRAGRPKMSRSPESVADGVLADEGSGFKSTLVDVTLDASNVAMGAPAFWSALGGDSQAGAGMKIAVCAKVVPEQARRIDPDQPRLALLERRLEKMGGPTAPVRGSDGWRPRSR